MDGPGDVVIPAKGEWFICLEAFYTPNQQSYQRTLAREEPESYRAILGKVVVTTDAAVLLPLTDENITDTGRMDANLDEKGDLVVNGKSLNGETGLAFVTSVDDTSPASCVWC